MVSSIWLKMLMFVDMSVVNVKLNGGGQLFNDAKKLEG